MDGNLARIRNVSPNDRNEGGHSRRDRQKPPLSVVPGGRTDSGHDSKRIGSPGSDAAGERGKVGNKPDFEIQVPQPQRFDPGEGGGRLSGDVMLEKTHVCRELTSLSHRTLAQLGPLDANLESTKMKKLQERFQAKFNDVMEKMATARDIIMTGPLAPVIGVLFREYWKEQGFLQSLLASLNKKRMGEIEHAFILKTLSQSIEDIAIKMEQSNEAGEVKFYNNQLKRCLRTFVEWTNEYSRLYRTDQTNSRVDRNIRNIYDDMERVVSDFDRILVVEIHPGSTDTNVAINPELAGQRNQRVEMNENMDSAKRSICTEALGYINTLRSNEADKEIAIDSLRNKILAIDTERNRRKVLALVVECKDIVYRDWARVGLSDKVYRDILKKIETELEL